MSEQIIDQLAANGPSTDPNDVVKFTQQLRYRIVDELTADRTTIPQDTAALAGILRDMDQSALTSRKLNIEEASANDGKRFLETLRRVKDAFAGQNPLVTQEPKEVNPLAGVNIPEIEISPLEAAQGEQPLNIHDFVPEE